MGLLDPETTPTRQVLLSLPYFDTQQSKDHGILQFVGEDERGDMVFSVGLETAAEQAIRAINNLLAIANVQEPRLIFIATMPTVNTWMKLGGVTSRAFGLKKIGRPLVIQGTQKAYPKIVLLVQEVKGKEGRGG